MTDTRERDTTKEIRTAVEKFFKRSGIKYKKFDNENVASATYSVDTRFGHATIFFHAYNDRLILHTIIPIKANEEERPKVAEFILRANYGLKVGGFDFDFEDGEISYRMSLYFGIEEFKPPTHEQIDFAIICSLVMVEKYGDALVKVMFGLVEPVDAIEDAEDDEEEEDEL